VPPLDRELRELDESVAKLRSRERRERRDRELDFGSSALRRVPQAARGLDRELDRGQVARAARLDGFADHVPLGGAAVRHRVDQRQRRFPLGEIVADVLAELLYVRVVIERVVDELECLTEMAAVRRERLLDVVALLGKDRADPRAGLEQLRRLAV